MNGTKRFANNERSRKEKEEKRDDFSRISRWKKDYPRRCTSAQKCLNRSDSRHTNATGFSFAINLPRHRPIYISPGNLLRRQKTNSPERSVIPADVWSSLTVWLRIVARSCSKWFAQRVSCVSSNHPHAGSTIPTKLIAKLNSSSVPFL